MTWIVKNTLKATLSFRGLDLSIGAGEEFDLDTRPGRNTAEGSDQVVVAFEEGYLQNVYKEPQPTARVSPSSAISAGPQITAGMTQAQIDASLDRFKEQVLTELRAQLSGVQANAESATSSQLEDVRSAISNDMQELVGELKLVRDRFASVRGRIQEDESLSDAEIRARMAFLEEQERELMKNFETVGREVESDDGDVMDKADLLANL
jgi:hypothetical protein